MDLTKWDLRYLDLAKNISKWSKDPSKKIGAVIVGEKGQIISTGFNGFPRNIQDTEERLNNRELKYKFIIHAENNAIFNAVHNGVPLSGSSIYVYGLPICNECAKSIIQCGIKKALMSFKDEDINDIWIEKLEITKELFKEAGIDFEILYDYF